jgi:hypothetical protein
MPGTNKVCKHPAAEASQNCINHIARKLQWSLQQSHTQHSLLEPSQDPYHCNAHSDAERPSPLYPKASAAAYCPDVASPLLWRTNVFKWIHKPPVQAEARLVTLPTTNRADHTSSWPRPSPWTHESSLSGNGSDLGRDTNGRSYGQRYTTAYSTISTR